ncbi:MAG: hypothetical protein RMX26_06015, partial [Planktomarina sp.]|nr:hypothetical protein [Planktomarina sp.]
MPVVPCIFPLLWFVTVAALIANAPSASTTPLLVMFSVAPPLISAMSKVVLACKVPLLLSVPVTRAVTLPVS